MSPNILDLDCTNVYGLVLRWLPIGLVNFPADSFYPSGNFCNFAGSIYWRRPQKDCLSVFKLCSWQIPSERLLFFWSVKDKEKKRAALLCICIPHCQLTGKLHIAKTKIALTSVLDLWVSSWKGAGQRCGMGFWKSRCRFLGVRAILLAAIIYIGVGSGRSILLCMASKPWWIQRPHI